MRLEMESKCPFGVPWSNSPLSYFSTRPAVVSGLSKAVSRSRFGLEPTAIWGISVEELFHDARHPHSRPADPKFLSRPWDRRFCWRETRRPLIWRAFFSCYRHWISIRVKLR